MRIKTAHISIIEAAIHKGCYQRGTTLGGLFNQVIEQGLGDNPIMYTMGVAFNWAHLHMPEHYISDVIYAYADDTHINSMLRHIFKVYNKDAPK